MNLSEKNAAEIKSAAVAWLTRRDDGLSATEEAAFRQWRDSSPQHATAVAEFEAAWSALDGPRRTGTTEFVRREIARRSQFRKWQRRTIGATSLALLIFAGFWMQRSPTIAPRTATARVVVPARQSLSDGSIAHVPLGARIETRYDATARQLELVSGEGFFIVKKDARRPFIVQAGPFRVQAVGTQFAVRLAANDCEVVVTEGRVAVTREGDTEPTLVDHDHKLTLSRYLVPVTRPAPVPLNPAQLSQHLTFRTPRLEFTDTSIGEAIALFNRHNDIRLKAADRAVAELLVTGIFRADNVQGFVNVLEKSFDLRADRRNPHEIVLHGAK